MMKINWMNDYVRDFVHHAKKLDVKSLYNFPAEDKTKKWIAETGSLLKKINNNDYLEFVKLCQRINPTIERIKREDNAHAIDMFVRMKAEEYPIQDIDNNFEENYFWKITNPIWITTILFVTTYKLIKKFRFVAFMTIILTILGYLALDYDRVIINANLFWKSINYWFK